MHVYSLDRNTPNGRCRYRARYIPVSTCFCWGAEAGDGPCRGNKLRDKEAVIAADARLCVLDHTGVGADCGTPETSNRQTQNDRGNRRAMGFVPPASKSGFGHPQHSQTPCSCPAIRSEEMACLLCVPLTTSRGELPTQLVNFPRCKGGVG